MSTEDEIHTECSYSLGKSIRSRLKINISNFVHTVMNQGIAISFAKNGVHSRHDYDSGPPESESPIFASNVFTQTVEGHCHCTSYISAQSTRIDPIRLYMCLHMQSWLDHYRPTYPKSGMHLESLFSVICEPLNRLRACTQSFFHCFFFF